MREGRLLDRKWASWVFTGATSSATGALNHPIGVAGGGPGVNAGLESDGQTTAIVLANLDPPMTSQLAMELYRALN